MSIQLLVTFAFSAEEELPALTGWVVGCSSEPVLMLTQVRSPSAYRSLTLWRGNYFFFLISAHPVYKM